MTRSDYEERRENRIERFQELAQKKQEESAVLGERARAMADLIPFGQPILIGHHSEKKDRNFRAKIWNTQEKSMEAGKKAEYYSNRADSAIHNKSISSDNPEALELLKEKLHRLELFQERAKQINKLVRKKISDEEKIKGMVLLGVHESIAKEYLKPDYAGRIGVPAYELTNNNGNMRRIKERIAALENESKEQSKEYEVGDIQILDSIEENRIMIYFPGVPAEGIREYLKSSGFRWSPTNGAWQAYRTAAWKIPYIIKMLTSMPGYVSPVQYQDLPFSYQG